MWCIGELTPEYIKRMEDILDLYELPYNTLEPVICFDEKMHHLVEDVRTPLPMKEGYIKRRDYEYERNGSCNVFCIVEPRAGRHLTYVTKNRRATGVCKGDKENREAVYYSREDSHSVGQFKYSCQEIFGGILW